jgi:hypothetical protein
MSSCQNCGEVAGPEFCPHCGQEVEPRRGPLLEVGGELLSEWLSFDSRLLRSLRALVRPGRLSELYLAGKRAPFLRPFRLYLLASVVLFSTLLTLEPPDEAGLNIYIGGELVISPATGDDQRDFQILANETSIGRWLIGRSGDQIARMRELPRQQVVDTLFSGLRRVLPLTLILFVPFLALGLKLLYMPIRRKSRERAVRTLYLDHLVFALHYQSALFLAISAAWLVMRIASVQLPASLIAYAVIAVAMILVYLPMALRRFYRQSWLWTGIKSFAVLYVYSQLSGLAFGLAVLVAIRSL